MMTGTASDDDPLTVVVLPENDTAAGFSVMAN